MKSNLSIRQIHFYATCLLAIFPLLPYAVMSISVMIWGIVSLLAILKEKKRPRHRSGVMFILSLSLFFFYLVSLLYSTDLAEGIDRMVRMLPLFILPLFTFYLPYDYSEKQVIKLIWFFIIGLVSSLFLAFGRMLANNFMQQLGTSKDPVTFTRIQIENYTNLHPSYLSLFLCFAIIFLLYVRINQKTRFRNLSLVILLFFLLTVFVLSAKMSILALCLSLLWFFSKGVTKRQIPLKYLFGALTGTFILLLAVPTTRARFSDFLEALSTTKIDNKNPDSIRKGIYISSFQLITENPIFGIGIGDTDAALKKQYKKNKVRRAFKMGFNSHNQYLDIWISAGIIPLLFFVLFLYLSFRMSSKNENKLQTAFLLLVTICLLTENLLSRQYGIHFFSLWSTLFLFQRPKMPLEFCINGRFLTQKTSGVQRYAREITQELKLLNPSVCILCPKQKLTEDSLPYQVKHIGPLQGVWWEQITLPIYCSLNGNPILLNMGNTAPIVYRYNITTVHDLSVYENYPWFKKSFVRYYKFLLPFIIKKSKAILTVSQFSADQIQNRFTDTSHKITVTYNGIANTLKGADDYLEEVPKEPYILTIGSNDPRKNVIQIIHAYLQSGRNEKLVIAGTFDHSIFNQQKIGLGDFNERILYVPNPSDEELISLYKNALVFVYLPIYEGFGLPILEALHHECPVVASDIPVFQELYNGCAHFVDPMDTTEISRILEQIIVDAELRNNLVKSSITIKDKYSYANSVEKIMCIFETLKTNESIS